MSFNEIDSYISEKIQNNQLCGVVLLATKDGMIVHEKAYGYAQKFQLEIEVKSTDKVDYLKEMNQFKPLASPIPLTKDYLFDLASLTKVLATTLGIMLLVDQKKINLDEPIKKYFLEFKKPDKKSITIRHLLSHSSGLAPWRPLYCHVKEAQAAIRYISELPLVYEAGSERKYSDLGFIILRFLIERVTQQKFDEFLQEALYSKLSLKNTLFNPQDKKYKIASTSHGNPFEYKMIADGSFGYSCEEKTSDFNGWRRYTLRGEVNDANTYHVFAGISGHAGLFSTASDINKLLALLLNQGCYHQEQLFLPETLLEFITKNKHQHGLGWAMASHGMIGDLPLGELANNDFFDGAFGHIGFTGTFILAIPKKNISLVLLTNTQHLGVRPNGEYQRLTQFYEGILKFTVKHFQS